jgi:putative membrane protein
MLKWVILFIKGFVIGIGKIIPGVSGAILAISLGVYEKGINSINNFFDDIVNNFKFLVTLGLGVMISIVLFSNVIKYSLDTFYLPTMLLFIGLIIGGIPMLFSKVEKKSLNVPNISISIIMFLIVILLSLLNTNNQVVVSNGVGSFLLMILIGFIDAATMIIPGISGTAILMLIGCYDIIIDTLSSLTSFSQIITNIGILIPFGIGIILGIILVVKVMAYLFKNHEIKTYYAIIGFALSSILLLFVQTMNNSYKISQVLIGFILLIIGYNISKKLDS